MKLLLVLGFIDSRKCGRLFLAWDFGAQGARKNTVSPMKNAIRRYGCCKEFYWSDEAGIEDLPVKNGHFPYENSGGEI